MPIIRDCEIYFTKLDPKRPSARFNKKNPTWELQIRTTDKAKKKEWEAMNLPVKAVVPDDDQLPYFRVNLRKKSIKSDGEPASPVKIVDGGLNDIDPNSIGNGSRGNIRVFQYEYDNEGSKGIASVLMAIQLTKHIVYTPGPREDDFDMEETEVIEMAPMQNERDDDSESEPAPSVGKKGPTPSPGRKPATDRPENEF